MRIEHRFEGANPQRAQDVEKIARDRFLIRPWSEDGDGNYKFRLNVRLINDTERPQPLTLHIDWQDLEYMSDRDYILSGRHETWRLVPAHIEGTVAEATLEVLPGAWYVGLHPVYDLGVFERERGWAVASGFTDRVIGRSHAGRDIVALSVGPVDAPAVFLISRFHPYETAGSYCISGILRELVQDLAADGPLTSRYRFVVVPMPNPDGVALGCCKRSRQGGPDLCHEGAASDDPAGQAVAALLAETAPQAYLDLHGWMWEEQDGLVYSHQRERDAFAAALADAPLFDKDWRGSSWADRPPRPGDFFMRASRDHGAVSFIISPSWFGRNVPQMREFGRKTLQALCDVVKDVS
jgi:hypothetical protein